MSDQKTLLREVQSDSLDETRLLDGTPLTEDEKKRREEARKLRERQTSTRKLLNG